MLLKLPVPPVRFGGEIWLSWPIQLLCEQGKIWLTSVIGIDEAEIQSLAALINIRYAWGGQFDDCLRQAID